MPCISAPAKSCGKKEMNFEKEMMSMEPRLLQDALKSTRQLCQVAWRKSAGTLSETSPHIKGMDTGFLHIERVNFQFADFGMVNRKIAHRDEHLFE